jgi:hypothetical protein
VRRGCGGVSDSDDDSDGDSGGGDTGAEDERLWGWADGRCRVVWADSPAGWARRADWPGAAAGARAAPWLESLAGKRSAVAAALAAAAALLV